MSAATVPFFTTPDSEACLKLLALRNKLFTRAEAFKLACVLALQLLEARSLAHVFTLAELDSLVNVSRDTTKRSLELIEAAGVCFTAELGSGRHKEVLIVLGLPGMLEHLRRYRAGEMSLAELLDRGRFACSEKFVASDPNPELSTKNLQQESHFSDLATNFSEQERAPEMHQDQDPNTVDKDQDPDLNMSGVDLDQGFEVALSVGSIKLEFKLPRPGRRRKGDVWNPNQLGCYASLISQTVSNLNDFVRRNPPGSAAPPLEPAPLAEFPPVDESTAPAAATSPPAPETQAPPKVPPAAPPGPPPAPGSLADRALQFGANVGQSDRQKQIDQQRETQRETQRQQAPEQPTTPPPAAAPAKKGRELTAAELEKTEAIRADLHGMVWRLWEDNIAVHEENDQAADKPRVKEFILELEVFALQEPEILLYLELAFEQAFNGGGKMLKAALINLHRIGTRKGIKCPDRWIYRAQRRAA